MAPGCSFRARQSWMASIPLDSLSSVQSRLLSPLPEWLDLSRCLLVHRRVELSLDLTLALLTTNWPGNLHVPHHVSQMNLKGMLVVFGTQVSISWHPSASFLQNSLLSLLASLFVSLSRCNCSSTLLPSLDFCRASMSLMVWSKIHGFYGFRVGFQVLSLLPLLHTATYQQNEKLKRRAYKERTQELGHGSFRYTIVLSATEGLGSPAQVTFKRRVSMLAVKHDQPYSKVMKLYAVCSTSAASGAQQHQAVQSGATSLC